MPLPTPKKGEKQEDFISRCMSNKTAKDEFPDNKQRQAVCFSQWRKKHGGKKPDKKADDMRIEYRHIPAEDMEIRESDDSAPVMSGLGIPYGKWSEDLGGFKERIMAGAATETLGRDDVRVIFNHDKNYVLGRKSAGTARFTEDKKGVHYEAELPDTQWARDLAVSIKRKDITENSFAMLVPADGEKWERKEGMVYRTITKLSLVREMGPQTFAAYPQTDVSMRSLDDVLDAGLKVLAEQEGRSVDFLRRQLELDNDND